MTRTTLSVALCATLLWAGAALATTTAQQKCDYARINAWRKDTSCVNSVVAKDAKGATSYSFVGVEFAAFAKCRHAYFKKWTTFQVDASLVTSRCIGTRFTDNGDGTATDNLSGLIWEKKDNLGDIHDKDNGYSWSAGAPYKENGTVFTDFLETINNNGFAGASGWRLPTLAELQTILLDFTCIGVGGGSTCKCGSSPCIQPALDAGNTQSNAYWSATGRVPDPGGVWDVYFDNGSEYADSKPVTFYVRVVRGGL